MKVSRGYLGLRNLTPAPASKTSRCTSTTTGAIPSTTVEDKRPARGTSPAMRRTMGTILRPRMTRLYCSRRNWLYNSSSTVLRWWSAATREITSPYAVWIGHNLHVGLVTRPRFSKERFEIRIWIPTLHGVLGQHGSRTLAFGRYQDVCVDKVQSEA